jgi:putative FmdB family regulatory protein
MPTYNYECECGRKRQETKLMSKCDEPVFCECGKEMKRLFGTANIIMVGVNDTYDVSTPFKRKTIDVEA